LVRPAARIGSSEGEHRLPHLLAHGKFHDIRSSAGSFCRETHFKWQEPLAGARGSETAPSISWDFVPSRDRKGAVAFPLPCGGAVTLPHPNSIAALVARGEPRATNCSRSVSRRGDLNFPFRISESCVVHWRFTNDEAEGERPRRGWLCFTGRGLLVSMVEIRCFIRALFSRRVFARFATTLQRQKDREAGGTWELSETTGAHS